jgi:hypothetical protein
MFTAFPQFMGFRFPDSHAKLPTLSENARMSKFRYVALSPERIEKHKEIGKALALHEFLVDHQTDPDGRVHYGKAISYAWIRSKWRNAPAERTLVRHMARLRSAGLVHVERLSWARGMIVRVIGSAKWQEQALQLRLFPAAEILLINSGRTVGKLSNSEDIATPEVASLRRHNWRLKEVKNLREEKTNSNTARSSPVEDAAALIERRRLLAAQAETLIQKDKTSCGGKAKP